MADLNKLPDELPLEVDNHQVEQYILQLAELTTDHIRRRPNSLVPPEAVEFIGKERVAMNEKINAIVQMSFQMQEAIRETGKTETLCEQALPGPDEKIGDANPRIIKLNEMIRSLVSFSVDPALSMSLISRLWKYQKVTMETPYDPKEYRLSPSTFHMNLERYARERNLPPFTENEKFQLFSAIKDWKLGKPPEQILKMLGYSIDAASHRASFPTRASREYARNRGINRAALSENVYRLREIETFLKDLFRQKKDPPVSPS